MSVNTWQKFLEGDEESFSELYRYYFSELFAYGTRIGFNEEVCKDAIQDVFYKLFISKARLTHIQNIEFYLIQSVRNRLYDIHNAETKIIRVNYDEVFQEHENSVIEKFRQQVICHSRSKNYFLLIILLYSGKLSNVISISAGKTPCMFLPL